MTSYQLTNTTSIMRVADGAIIPADPANVDYQAYQAWVAAGHAADPAPIPAALSLSQQAQAALDSVTGARGQIIRCAAAGVAVTTIWSSYVAALRAIANGTDKASTSLPVQPAYIEGT